MDPLAPIAGLTLERHAELLAEVAATRGDPLKIGEVLGRAGVPAADWDQARAGWAARLADPAVGGAIVDAFEARYHAELDRLLGPGPAVTIEDFAAMLGEALAVGLPAMTQRRGIEPLAWSRIAHRARAAIAADPARLSGCLGLAGQIAERRLAGEPKPTGRAFEQDAHVAAKAVGKALFSGLDAFGSAMDSVGKSLLGPSPGARVMVQWSDGKQYPGTVAQVGQGQCLVTMGDGSQHWIPEAFVKAV